MSNGSAFGAVGNMITPTIFQNAATQWGMDRQQSYDEKTARREWRRQKEFAKMGIRWKVADAAAAGIHPLYALGANTISYSPSRIGTDLQTPISNMGQNVARMLKGISNGQVDQFQVEKEQETITNMRLQNELLRKEVNKNENRISSAWGLTGQGDVDALLSDGNYHSPSRPSQSAIGLEKNPAARNIVHVDENGYVWFDPSQTASEGVTEGPGQISYYFGKWKKGLDRIYQHKNPNSEYARKSRLELRVLRDQILRVNPLPRGMEIHFDPYRAQFIVEKRTGKFYSQRANRSKRKKYHVWGY